MNTSNHRFVPYGALFNPGVSWRSIARIGLFTTFALSACDQDNERLALLSSGGEPVDGFRMMALGEDCETRTQPGMVPGTDQAIRVRVRFSGTEAHLQSSHGGVYCLDPDDDFDDYYLRRTHQGRQILSTIRRSQTNPDRWVIVELGFWGRDQPDQFTHTDRVVARAQTSGFPNEAQWPVGVSVVFHCGIG